jgi:hypothetical protein
MFTNVCIGSPSSMLDDQVLEKSALAVESKSEIWGFEVCSDFFFFFFRDSDPFIAI